MQKEKGVEGLVLSGGGDIAGGGQIREVAADNALGLPVQLIRLRVGEEPAHLIKIGLFRAQRIMEEADEIPHLQADSRSFHLRWGWRVRGGLLLAIHEFIQLHSAACLVDLPVLEARLSFQLLAKEAKFVRHVGNDAGDFRLKVAPHSGDVVGDIAFRHDSATLEELHKRLKLKLFHKYPS